MDDLIIDGNGYSIDAKNKTGIFKIYSKVTIKNLTLKNGHAIDGGAINIQDGELTITSSTLQENAAQRSGGAINNERCKLTITESTLNNNTVQNGIGGAIRNYMSKLTVTGSTLNNNTVQNGIGGAIYIKNSSELTIIESLLQENAADNGGEIYLGIKTKKI